MAVPQKTNVSHLYTSEFRQELTHASFLHTLQKFFPYHRCFQCTNKTSTFCNSILNFSFPLTILNDHSQISKLINKLNFPLKLLQCDCPSLSKTRILLLLAFTFNVNLLYSSSKWLNIHSKSSSNSANRKDLSACNCYSSFQTVTP